MKSMVWAVIAAGVLTACGGGGASSAVSGGVNNPTPSCTKPTAIGQDINVTGTMSSLDYSALPTLQNVTISGDTNTVTFKNCSFIKRLTITSRANSVIFSGGSDAEEIVFSINSSINSVTLPSTSSATVQDLGNMNRLIR